MRIAIDTGGTFTDCVFVSKDELTVLKLPSTPQDPAQAVLQAVAQISGNASAEVRHGTTVGTNALLERRGARVAFVTTSGFEDTIAIGRQARPKLYDLFFTKEPPLASEEFRFGVPERTASDGSILRAVSESDLRHLTERVRAAKPESIAVSLLFSFANPANEQAVASALRELGVPVSASHEILPEFREYERGSTTLINAYLAPKMEGYLGMLHSNLEASGSRLQVMQSSGGIVSASVAAREPVRTILSGPAGGVVGALGVARAAGFDRILTFDMGGTSTDVALLSSGAGLGVTTESQILGMPVSVPMLDIHTVGAGGGSLATFDRGGALKVGPQSAGADPGPICYGRGENPTVTDANLLLGRLDADWFLGGEMKLDHARTRQFCEPLKGRLASIETFANGIVNVVDSHMERALRQISVERGHDPRDCVLVSFGGAGPLHACALARALRTPKVLVPAMPGALSAYGILVSDIVRDYSRTVMLPPDSPLLAAHFVALEDVGKKELRSEGLTAVASRSLDMRYAGQGYELNVPDSVDSTAVFHSLHERRYGYSDARRPIEIVNVRVRLTAATEPFTPPRHELRHGGGDQAVICARPIFCDSAWQEGKLYNRARLRAGDRFKGPAVIVEYSATTFLPPGCRLQVDEYTNLVIDIFS